MCSATPRFSYEGPETGVPTMRTPWCSVRGGRVYRRGMGPGWVLGRAIPGTTQPPTQLLEEPDPDQRSGPVGPAGAGVVGLGLADVPAAGRSWVPTLRARSVLRPSLVPRTSECRLLANKGEI